MSDVGHSARAGRFVFDRVFSEKPFNTDMMLANGTAPAAPEDNTPQFTAAEVDTARQLGYEDGLRYVAGGKYDLFCVQILSPQEIEPELQGDLKLKDMEDDDMAEVSITQPLIKKYKENLNAYCLSLKDYLTRRGGTYLFTSTAVPFDTLVLNYLRERGLLG